jgi:aminoacrylate hydrolase
VLYASWAEIDPQMRMCLETRRMILRAVGEVEYHRATPIFLYPPYHVRDRKNAIDAEIEAAIKNSPPKSILDARVTGIMKFEGLQYLDKITCPVMVLVAEDDILTPRYLSDQMVARLRSPHVVKLSRGAHAVSRVEPALFNKTVFDFLGQHGVKGMAA